MINDLQLLREHCLQCKQCGLSETRTHVVFGVGVPKAEVMLIGEGPGEQEDLTGEPFVGRGGQLLDKMLFAVDLSRKQNIYIANIVKCRPPQNRDPLPEEQEACIGYLRNQVQLLRPKIIVCLGRIAAGAILGRDVRMMKEHGSCVKVKGFYIMPTFHPAALLHNPDYAEYARQDFRVLGELLHETGIS